MKGLEVRPTLSVCPLAFCILGALLVLFQRAMDSAPDAPEGGQGHRKAEKAGKEELSEEAGA